MTFSRMCDLILASGFERVTRISYTGFLAAAITLCAETASWAGCVWRGTAPYCAGQCRNGEVPRQHSRSAGGLACITGDKVLCCAPEPEPAAQGNSANAIVKAYCSDYADRMTARMAEAVRLNCAFVSGGGWDASYTANERQCIGYGDTRTKVIPYNESSLGNELAACKKKAGGSETGGGQTATAVNGADVYPRNDGNSAKFCEMNPGDKGNFLGAKPREPRWLHLSGITGACGGRTGWVWKGDNGEDVSVR
jgi:hypothetical protein